VRVVLLNQYYLPSEAPTGVLLGDVGAALVAAGHSVTAICARRDYADPELRYRARERIGGVTVRRTFGTGFGRRSRATRLLDYGSFLLGASLRLLVERRPDVIVVLTTPPMLALPALLIARLKGARLVYWVMDVYPDLAFALGALRAGSIAGRSLERLARRLLVEADAVVALGEAMAERLRRGGARRVEAFHNWADGAAIRPLPIDDHPLRRAWGWTDRFVVVYSGNLGLAHEFDTVLDAAERLVGRPDVRIAFVGGGPRRDGLEREVRRRRLSNVEFRPWMESRDLGLSLTAGDLHLVTLRPGLGGLLVPSKIYGVLAAGRPSIYVGPQDGEVASLLDAGGCGCTIEPGDGGALAAAIAAYADEAALCAEHGRRARALFERGFDRERGVERWVGLVEGLAR
jgi:glycosyltransferase involved in cell wall biosynthesis